MRKKSFPNGFSLVEVLVVMVIMGLVMTSVYGLYISNQRTASTQEDVVDLQQNLRIAMDWLTRDIRMAGFMVPKDQFAVDVASIDTITLKTACPSGRFAILSEDKETVVLNSVSFPIENSEMVSFFDSTTYCSVRIIRPPNHSQPIDAIFNVEGASGSTLTLAGFPGITDYSAGDVIVYNRGSHPQSVVYTLDTANNRLLRNDGDGAEEIAGWITSLTFAYYRVGNNTPYNSLSGDSRSDIRAVSVTLQGEVPSSTPGESPKIRSINSVIGIRNI